MPNSPERTSYDELPYPSFPFAQTHPDRLATLATLLGLKPARADRCWVLELGCAAGGNLIPLASAFPQSTFLGLDLSGEQISSGKKTIDELGLKNITLERRNITDIGDRFGEFDFIICHGVYSWVPRAVQDKILKVYKQCLAREGVGFISYNTYPGWHMRGMVRAMMGLHDRRFRDRPPLVRVGQARALLSFLVKSAPAGNGPYTLLLKEQLEMLEACSDAYLFHEHLEECNEPLYFTDFCERLTAAGLRYLGEAELGVMVPSTSFPPDVQAELSQVAPNQIEMEQYMDLLRNRSFRQTLIVHDHVSPRYEIRGEHIFGFRVASSIQPPAGDEILTADVPEEFKGRHGLVLTTASPLVKAAARCLAEAWPGSIPFDGLLAAAWARLKAGPAPDRAAMDEEALELARALLTAFATTGKPLVELSLCPPCFAAQVSERPVAGPLVRLQAKTSHQVTSLRHETVSVPDFDRHLLQLMDGSRDRRALLDGLLECQARGEIRITADEEPVTDPTRLAQILGETIDQQLPKLAREALLIA
jgi:methyltransferase-like protein/SAM-dependent methyltransferase